MERQIIKYLLKATNGNKQLTATKLGISRTTIWSKLKSSQQETDFSIPSQDVY
ncbi:helix-turn-helix domain-containing protein [Colibacter massiliensis]|nr:helix-turn-helix domain-containing protein [Colibacter massiliensis]